MKRAAAAVAFVLVSPAWALDFWRSDTADYAQEAAAMALQAESLCITPINRRGKCEPRGGPNRTAFLAMSRANVAIDNFYAKCELVFRGDMSTCDVMMGAFLNEARQRNGTAP